MNDEAGLAAALRWQPDSAKARVLAAILLTLFSVYGIAYLASAAVKGWPQGFGDSFALWSWGRFLADHPATAIYDTATLHSAQLAMGMKPGASYPFVYPPSYLPLLWLLGQLPGPVACAALIGATLPLYLWATVGRAWRSPALVTALAAPTTAIAVVSGQSGFLTAAIFAGGVRLAAGNPVLGGVLFGVLSYKPQLGLLVPVALAAARLWRTLAVAAGTAVLLVVATTALFGAAIWPDWAAAMPAYSRQFATEGDHLVHLMPTIFAALSQLGAPPLLARTLQWATAAAAAAGVWMLFRSGAGPLQWAGLLVAALLATPYAFVYDMPILATAVIWLHSERKSAGDAFGTGEIAVMMFAMLSPITLAAATSRVPIAAAALVLLFGMIIARWRRLRVPPGRGWRRRPIRPAQAAAEGAAVSNPTF